MNKYERDVSRMGVSVLSEDFASPYTFRELDFFVCEYAVGEGKLLYGKGGLLASYGMAVPGQLAQLSEAPGAWPLEAEYREQAAAYFSALVQSVNGENGAPSLFEMLVTVEGKQSWVCVSSAMIDREHHRGLEIRFMRVDNEKRELARLVDRSETDPLTGALNRTGLAKCMQKFAADGRTYAFIMLDVDGFKHFNDTYGHLAGDALLTRVAQKLSDGLEDGDLIARVGGDEFVICLYNPKENESVQRTARYVQEVVLEDMPANTHLSVSMGVAISPRDGTDFEELYHKADIAMYNAKRQGGNGCLFYESDMVMPGISEEDAPREIGRQHLLVKYDTAAGRFEYAPELGGVFRATFDGRALWDVLEEDRVARADTALRLRETILQVCSENGQPVLFSEYLLKTADGMWRWFRIGAVLAGSEQVVITLSDVNDELHGARHMPEYDGLTGLPGHTAFARKVERILTADPTGAANGDYAMLYFDIIRFKGINDRFGVSEGDKLLMYIANGFASLLRADEAVCRIVSDRFALMVHRRDDRLIRFVETYFNALKHYPLSHEIISNMGIYRIDRTDLSADAMLDRAILAQKSIKGNYEVKYAFYSEDMRSAMLGEQEITGAMNTALAERQFVVYYQPQYDHSTGELIGAEALVRWLHPEHGLVPPGRFIPLFEKNGFITRLDFYVFDQVCRYQRKCIDAGIKPVPISVNLTQYDIYQSDFIDILESSRLRYDVPVELLRIEITETAVVGDNRQASRVIEQLHQKGYVVEMDDFGSGYSSLNVLKDIELDVLKLDMRFLSGEMETSRSGNILSSVVRMANGLELTVIAEGVERLQQADYLRSIGCNLVQGYLYQRPVPETEFTTILKQSTIGSAGKPLHLLENMDMNAFWNPDSQETLVFNHYVGGAMIFDYRDGRIGALRVNPKYLQEMNNVLPEKDIFRTDLLTYMDEENRRIYERMLKRAIDSRQEEECETWRDCGCGRVCVRSTVRLIGYSKDAYLFYEAIRNITDEKNALQEVVQRENLFRAASEQVNIYYWEYDFATGNMIPCHRCKRDLNMTDIMPNYPESAIEMGVFPPETADAYRAFIRKVETSEGNSEIVLPLTKDRVVFRIRYTTVCDEKGKPCKAYASAVPV
ncbi:MAG: bifunctional diguanylate cyclase/phosphodiesterase [Clostridia bacterium]|nr:bifunctional diguanylate cyclase/phosphodiesterase [Clostridia bacterium]